MYNNTDRAEERTNTNDKVVACVNDPVQKKTEMQARTGAPEKGRGWGQSDKQKVGPRGTVTTRLRSTRKGRYGQRLAGG